jgi:hypothetical protein
MPPTSSARGLIGLSLFAPTRELGVKPLMPLERCRYGPRMKRCIPMICFHWFMAVTGVPLVTGCLGSSKADLADLVDLEVHVVASHPYDEVTGRDAPARVEVTLDYSWGGFRDRHSAECADLRESVVATYNGVRLTLERSGGVEDDDLCYEPRFAGLVPLGVDAPGELTIEDDTHAMHASYAAGVISPRHAILLSHDRWAFAAGDVISFAWSHAQDLVFPEAEVTVRSTAAINDVVWIPADNVVPSSGGIDVRIQDPAPFAGNAWMDIIVKHANVQQGGQATACDGALRCTFSQPWGYRHVATLE